MNSVNLNKIKRIPLYSKCQSCEWVRAAHLYPHRHCNIRKTNITHHGGDPACPSTCAFELMDPSNIIRQPNTRTLRTKEYFPSISSLHSSAPASTVSSGTSSSDNDGLDSSHSLPPQLSRHLRIAVATWQLDRHLEIAVAT